MPPKSKSHGTISPHTKEQLIEHVRGRSALWDKGDERYHNAITKQRDWADIGEIVSLLVYLSQLTMCIKIQI